jgi:hypothetical protein
MANNVKEKQSMHCGIILSENGREIKAWQKRMVALIFVNKITLRENGGVFEVPDNVSMAHSMLLIHPIYQNIHENLARKIDTMDFGFDASAIWGYINTEFTGTCSIRRKTKFQELLKLKLSNNDLIEKLIKMKELKNDIEDANGSPNMNIEMFVRDYMISLLPSSMDSIRVDCEKNDDLTIREVIEIVTKENKKKNDVSHW